MTVVQPTPASSKIPHAALEYPFQGASVLIALIILTILIRQVDIWQIARVHVRIGDALIAVCFVLWLVAACMRERWLFPTNLFDQVVVIFVVLYVLSILWGSNIERGLYQGLKIMRNGMLYILLVEYLSVNFVSRYLLVSWCLLAAGFMQSFAFIWSMAENGGIVALERLLQAELVLSNNDFLLGVVKVDQGGGIFLRGVSTWLPLCAFMAFSIVPFVSRWKRISLRLLIVLMGTLIVLAGSRGGWLAVIVGIMTIVCLTPLRIRLSQFLFSVTFLGFVLGGGIYFSLHSYIAARLLNVDIFTSPSFLIRLEYFKVAWDAFCESPIFGNGVGNILKEEFFVVHNVYLQVLGELGVVGVLLFVALIMLWLWLLFSARQQAMICADRFIAKVSVVMLGMSTFLLAYFLTAHDLGDAAPWFVMSIASAIFTHMKRNNTI